MLGEGAFWHPERERLYWLDIPQRLLLTRDRSGSRSLGLPEMISAMGWIDRDRLFLAGESRFWILDLRGEAVEPHVALEAERPRNRSNDGRADPFGGFWIGTMEREGEPGQGRIWRYLRGEVHLLFAGLAIPNAICFAPDGSRAYFTDTPTGVIRRVALDREGWPTGSPCEHVLVTETEGSPDGAVVDADGNLWVALWGGGRVAGFDPLGRRIGEVILPARQTTCPAFGGDELTTLFVTSAAVGLEEPRPEDGATFRHAWRRRGLRESRVVLGKRG